MPDSRPNTHASPRPRRALPALSPAILLSLAGIATTIIEAPAALARQPQTQMPILQTRPGAFTGRDFAGVNLPVAPQPHNLSVRAARATVWNEGATNRILLERDVVVNIGPHEFYARRASIWLEPVLIDNQPADQIAIFFEEVNNPRAASGRGIQQARRLLVTALLVEPDIRLRTDLIERGRPDSAFLTRAEERLATHLTEITDPAAIPRAERRIYGLPVPRGETPQPPQIVALPPPADDLTAPLAPIPLDPALVDRPLPTVQPGEIIIPPAFADNRPQLPPAQRTEPIMPTGGNIAFSAGETRFVARPDGTQAIALTGSVALQVVRDDGDPSTGADRRRAQQITAERAVIFLGSDAPGAFARYNIDSVQGVYLEGDAVLTEIARDGDVYTLRGSRIYYDIPTNRAVLLDAVFYSYQEQHGLPLYLRAEAIRQHSSNQWSASGARLSNVAFADPHFSIGVEEVTVTRIERPAAPDGYFVDAQGVGFYTGNTALIGVPSIKGELRDGPLKEVRIERAAGDNVIRTTWDLYTLLGVDVPPGNRADLLIDGFLERGPAVGIDMAWERESLSGSLYGYGIFDNGRDKLSSGAERGQNDEFRGVITAENIWRLDDQWTLFLEGSYISDETFIDAFFLRDAQTRREFTNSAYLRRLVDNEFFSLEARGTFNDFLPNQYLLQSQGYTVERLPEVRYARVAEQLFDLFSYTAEASFSRMSLVFNDPELRKMGYNNPRRSLAGFGLLPTDSLADELSAAGYSESSVLRFDTRHEIEIPLVAGPFNFVPFAVGRFTVYDSDFDDFRGPNANDDKHRFWAAGGVHASTSMVRIDDSVRSDLFDLNRIRHIIEPSITFWSAGTTLDSRDLPVYDEHVEALSDGTVVRTGMRQTWQTMRGRGENQYSVDWLVLNTDYVWSSNDATIESPFGRFYDFRPEYSFFGEFFDADARMQLTDAVTLVGEFTHDIDNSRTARASGGFRIDHGFGFSTFTEARYLHGIPGTVIIAGADYEISRKYAVGVAATWDLDDNELQRLDLDLVRRFPQWTMLFRLELDEITDRVSLGIAFRPAGFAGDPRDRIFTYEERTLEPIRSPSSLRRGKFTSGPLGG